MALTADVFGDCGDRIAPIPDLLRSDGTITVTFQKATDIQPAATNSTSQPAAVDPLVQLEKLGQLRDDGVLTAEEFESKKADLLSRL